MIQVRYRICALLLTILALGNYNGFAQKAELEEKVRKDLLERIPDIDIKRVQHKHWGGVWLYGRTNTKFENSVEVRGTYGTHGKWLRDLWYISKEILPAAITDQIPEGLGDSKVITYNENYLGFKHYEVEMKSARFYLFNEQLEEIPYGPMVDGIVMTPELNETIFKKLNKPKILSGWKNDELTRQIFAVTFETDNGHINHGQVVFDNDNKWVKTIYYLKDYFKLPLELLMYVNDIGGLEVFRDIVKIEATDKVYYDVRLKDDEKYKLDVNLDRI